MGTSIRMIHPTNKSLKVDTLESNQYDRLNIRIFRHDDLPLLQEMIIRCHKHSHFFREPRFQLEESKKLFAGWMEKCAKGLAERIYIAEDNNKLLGFCSLLSNKSLLNFINKKIGIIDFIVVDESAQGRGVGKSLLNTAFSFFQEFDFIELRTMADNIGAIRFYQKNGFFILSADEYYHFWT
ncbi:GNAT family N-acetyltransferase [bacterium]|nr:GNAT family N-acetyltransferase [bacterium]